MTCRNAKKSFLQYSIFFILLSIIGYSPFWTQGKSMIWKIDGLGQYYLSFLYIGQYLREYFVDCLHGSLEFPLFDLSIGMGDDIIGTLNYYGFGDPLNLLAIFTTKNNGAYIFTGMYFLRLYLSGLFFRKYSSYFGLDETLSTAGALCYVFSGYALIGGASYIQFLSPMMYLPLVLLGCEKILHENKTTMFTVSVAYAALCNFYFLYMTSLFLIIYFIVRSISIYGIRGIRKILNKVIICIASYLLGIMLAAPILFSSIDSFLNSYRNTMNLKDLIEVKDFFPNIDKFYQYIKGIGIEYTTDYWTGIPPIQYASLIGTLLVIKGKRSQQCALAVILGTVFWCIPITSIVFSGFGKVYTRWVFLLYFIFAIVFICFFDGFIKTTYWKKILLLAITINIGANLIMLYSNKGENWSDEFIAFSNVHAYISSPTNMAKSITDSDSIYRIANEIYTDINGRPENIAMINGYNGLNCWFSIINGNVQRMIDQVGTSKRTDWRSYGLNNITIYETLAGVKYYICPENHVEKAGYKCVENVVFNDDPWKIYQNENALPLVYTYDECITKELFEQLNELEKAEATARYIVLDNGCVNPISKIDPILFYEPETIYENSDASLMCYAESDEIYLKIDSYEQQDKVGKYMLNNNSDLSFEGKKGKKVIYNLGKEYMNSKLVFSMDSTDLANEEIEKILKQTKVYAMNTNQYQNIIQERNTLKESNVRTSKNKINISNAQMNETGWILLAVPYSKHWKCYVDGKETSIYKGNTLYMAIRMETGKHEIVFSYGNVSFYAGIAACLTAVCIIVFWHIFLPKIERISQK